MVINSNLALYFLCIGSRDVNFQESDVSFHLTLLDSLSIEICDPAAGRILPLIFSAEVLSTHLSYGGSSTPKNRNLSRAFHAPDQKQIQNEADSASSDILS